MQYVIKQALRSLWRNFWLCVASVLTMMVSLAILGFALILLMTANNTAKGIESQVQIRAYVGGEFHAEDEAKLEAIQEEIRAMSQVISIRVVTPEEGLDEHASGSNMTAEDVLQSYGGNNFLPYRLEIDISDVELVPDVAETIGKIDGVHNASYGQGTLETILSFTSVMKIGGAAVVSIFAFAAFVLISLNIRSNVFYREKEIQIMRLVGASNMFIRGPFFVEGMLVGIIGAVLSVVTVGLGYSAFVRLFSETASQWLLVHNVGLVLVIMLLGGVLIGALASMVSMRRFLKV